MRIISHAYGAGIFQGVEFKEEVIDGFWVGVGESSDPETLLFFNRQPSFEVVWDNFTPQTTEATSTPDLSSYTIRQLRRYAAENDIDVHGMLLKSQILATIKAA